MTFYTIGYEGVSLEQYLNKLQKYQIKYYVMLDIILIAKNMVTHI
ncbi:MAG: hypothetical protein RCG15_00370 [Candidatus Rickettsia vulgarisii]